MKDENTLTKLYKTRIFAMTGIWLTSIATNVFIILLCWPKLLSVLQGIEGWTHTFSNLVFIGFFTFGFVLTNIINKVVQKGITRSFDKNVSREAINRLNKEKE